jgi:hypothetical protein
VDLEKQAWFPSRPQADLQAGGEATSRARSRSPPPPSIDEAREDNNGGVDDEENR